MYAFLDTGNLDSRHLPFAPVVLRRQSIEFGKQPHFPGGSLRRGLPESQQRIVPEPKTFLRRIAFSSETDTGGEYFRRNGSAGPRWPFDAECHLTPTRYRRLSSGPTSAPEGDILA